jgi:hypothetical protein
MQNRVTISSNSQKVFMAPEKAERSWQKSHLVAKATTP